MELTEEQKRAIRTIGKPVLVLAGPGTGKTEVLAQRIKYLLENERVTKEQITAITFTKKAAYQMQKRLIKLGIPQKYHPWIGTLHSLAMKILKENYKEAEIAEEFFIADEYESILLIKDAALEVTNKSIQTKKAKRIFNKILLYKVKNKSISPDIIQILKKYKELLNFYDALDFEDLILFAIDLLKKHKNILEVYKSSASHLLVDEFQDINPSEYEFIKLLAGNGDGLFVVGDDDQSIYSWRGGTPEIILGFSNDYPTVEETYLTKCFRCPKAVVLAANKVIGNNKNRKNKKLSPTKEENSYINILMSSSYDKEAKWISEWITRKLKDGKYESKDIAILYRGGDIADKIAEYLQKNKIPIMKPAPEETKSEKEFMAFLRVIDNRNDSLALRVCLDSKMIAKNIGQKCTLKLVKEAQRKHQNLWQTLQESSKDPKFKRWRNYINSFIKSVRYFEERLSMFSLQDFLLEIAIHFKFIYLQRIKELIEKAQELPRDASLYDFIRKVKNIEEEKDQNAVLFVTTHSVKGLERDVIFLIGMEKGRFPNSKDPEEEQRRLFYVALTRAKDEIFLSYSKTRKGKSAKGFGFYDMSKFIFEIPEEFRNYINNYK